MQVASFVIGEFSQEDNGSIDLLLQILEMPQTLTETKLYIVTALSKLAVRLNKREIFMNQLSSLSVSNDLELQQRAGEMGRILSLGSVADTVLAPLLSTGSKDDDSKIDLEDHSANSQNTPAEDTDLLLLVTGEAPPQNSKNPQNSNSIQNSNNTQNPNQDLLSLNNLNNNDKNNNDKNNNQNLISNDDDLLNPLNTPSTVNSGNTDLLGLMTDNSNVQKEAPKQINVPPGAKEWLKTNEFIAYAQVQANVKDPRQFAVQIVAFGLTQKVLAPFKVSIDVRNGWQVKSMPPDGVQLPPAGGPPLKQIVYLFNPSNAALSLKLTISYMFGSQPVTESTVITSLQ